MAKKLLVFLLVLLMCCSSAVTALAALHLRAPDYDDPTDWVYRGCGEEKAADVFLLAPTVAASYGCWNMSLDDEMARANFAAAVEMQMGLYGEECRVFSPYYREAAYGVYSLEEAEREAYLSLAYGDVSEAFRWYLENANNGRPIILAGYSQGADMVRRLLEEYFEDPALRSRLVAAYAIGWAITREDVARSPWLKMAKGEDDVGVIVSFECEVAGLARSKVVETGVTMLSINPLNWETDGSYASSEYNLGSCFMDYNGSVYAEAENLTGAYIDPERGTLICTDVTPEDYPPLGRSFQPGEYHWYDYQFFYRNIQENVSVRLAAWFRQTRTAELI